jgi:hypothetical protein
MEVGVFEVATYHVLFLSRPRCLVFVWFGLVCVILS